MQDHSALRTKSRPPALSIRKAGAPGTACLAALTFLSQQPNEDVTLEDIFFLEGLEPPPGVLGHLPWQGMRKHPSPLPLGSEVGGVGGGALIPHPLFSAYHIPFRQLMPPFVNPAACLLLQVRGRRRGGSMLEIAGRNLGRLSAGGKCEEQAAKEKREIDEGNHGKNPNCNFPQPP